MFDIAKEVNKELEQYGLKWSDFHTVKSLRTHSFNNPRNHEKSIRIIVEEHYHFYDVRVFNLYKKTEVHYRVNLELGSRPYGLDYRHDFELKQAENHFDFYKKIVENSRHVITHYTI